MTKGTSGGYAGAADFAISIALVLGYNTLQKLADSTIAAIRSKGDKGERDVGPAQLLALAREILSYRDADTAVLAVRRAAEAFGECSSFALYWSDAGTDLRLISSSFVAGVVPDLIAHNDVVIAQLAHAKKPTTLAGNGDVPAMMAFPILARGVLRGAALCVTINQPLASATQDAVASSLQALGIVLLDSPPNS